MDNVKSFGGGRLVHCMSVTSPEGRYYVLCDAHPEFHTEVCLSEVFARLNDDKLFENVIQEGLYRCPWCTAERLNQKYPYTRFPEGSEL